MKRFLSPYFAFFGFCTALVIQPASAQVSYEWNNHATGAHLWSNPDNWVHYNEDDLAREHPITGTPGNPESGLIQFIRNGAPGQSSYTVVMDTEGDQRIAGGILLNKTGTTSLGTLTLDIDENRLIVDGSSVFVYPSSSSSGHRTVAIVTNGTLRLGDTHSASLILGESGTAAGSTTNVITTKFTGSSVLDTANTSNISISSSIGSTRINNMRLDLADAKLISGSLDHTLSVTQSIAIGYVASGAGYTRKGEMNLGVLSTLSIGQDLVLGHTNRTSSTLDGETGKPVYDTAGVLTFSEAEAQGAVTMNIGRDLRIGVGAAATGEIQHLPDELHLKIGSDAARGGVVHVGYKQVTQAAAVGNSIGSFVSNGGTLEAYLTEFRVGQNANTAENPFNNAQGTFDFRASTLSVLNITGDAVIGLGTNAVGTVWLHGGEASSLNLTVGSTMTNTGSPIGRSLLNLDGTQWTVSEVLTIGPNGDLRIQLAADGSGGLDLLSEQTSFFTIEEGGLLSIRFDDLPEGEMVWGLRMAGDQTLLFENYLESHRIAGTGTYGNAAGIFTYNGYTYYGIAAIPEPETWGLILSAGVLLLVSSRRKAKKTI